MLMTLTATSPAKAILMGSCLVGVSMLQAEGLSIVLRGHGVLPATQLSSPDKEASPISASG